jgi:hypothetical protein
MSPQNDKEGSGHVKAAIIGGIFVVIAACITGVFLVVNTMVEKDKIAFGTSNPSLSPTAIVSQSQEPVIVPTNTNLPANTEPSAVDINPIVSIKDVGSYTGQNLGLAEEMQIFNGVEFETGWIATTQSKGGVDENKPSSYKVIVQNHIINSSKVYFLWQASWAVDRSGAEIGSINIHISNGQVVQEKIIVGYNIRDWSDVSNKLSAPSAQEAHNNGNGVVDMFAVNIPVEYNGYEITEIDIQDISEAMGIHLWAITIK